MNFTIKNISKDSEQLLKGVNKIADAVKITLGAKGKNVIIEKEYGNPIVTKDGVTVAKEIFLKDSFENIGAQLLKEAALKTAEQAGDGTTTAIVLAESIYREGLKSYMLGKSSLKIKRGIDLAVKETINYLDSIKQSIKENSEKIKQVATVSANNDSEIGGVIAEAIEKAGENGAITVKASQAFDTYIDFVEGMEIDKGYLSPYFITDLAKMKAELNDAYILIINKNISVIKPLLPILQQVTTVNKPLLIIADKLEGEALSTLVINHVRGNIQCCVISSPGFGNYTKDQLEDIAVLTGGVIVSDERGIKLEDLTLDKLGTAKRIIVEKDKTIIENGGGSIEEINKRIEILKEQLNDEIGKGANENLINRLRTRIAKLAGGVSIINVGAMTETELKEKLDRIDDSLHATRAALEEGIVAGGGIALFRASQKLEELKNKIEDFDEKIGIEIVKRALESPLRTILSNADLQVDYIVGKIIEEKDERMGYNLLTNKIENLIETGIIDPVKVTKTALLNAVSVASLLLSSGCTIALYIEENNENNNNKNVN